MQSFRLCCYYSHHSHTLPAAPKIQELEEEDGGHSPRADFRQESPRSPSRDSAAAPAPDLPAAGTQRTLEMATQRTLEVDQDLPSGVGFGQHNSAEQAASATTSSWDWDDHI